MLNFMKKIYLSFSNLLILIMVLAGLVLQIYTANAQSDKRIERMFAQARQQFELKNFTESVALCTKIINKNNTFADAYLLLADIYNSLDSAHTEIKYLKHAKDLNSNPLIDFRLAEASIKIGKYQEAIGFYKRFLETGKISEEKKDEINRKIDNCKFAAFSVTHPVEFNPERLPSEINTVDDEYWPVFSLDQKTIVFTRLVKQQGVLPQEDFYETKMDSVNWSVPAPLVDINTAQNEGAQCLSADGKLLFFTACNRSSGYGSCDIYFSSFENGKWSSPQNAGKPLNSGAWEAQPSFSSDNKYLYFSSNRAGGFGKKDIWRAELLLYENGRLEWSKPENLGESINSPGDEISPFIHPNNVSFYFVSDYHTGMGGFDIFTAKHTRSGEFSSLENMGFPINTPQNEQGLTVAADGKTALFASERNKISGLDIYQFQLDEELQVLPVTYARAKVSNAKTGEKLEAKVTLTNLTDNSSRSEYSDKNGEMLVCLPVGNNYAFNVTKDGFLFYSRSFLLEGVKSIENPTEIDILLNPVEPGAEMNLYNIYFETDSFSLMDSSEPELLKLYGFLNENEQLQAEIQGHTDNTGDSSKNLVLSEKRAKSVVDYLLKKGIEKARLKWVGFGETKPVDTNETVEGRRKNRRTTLKILGKTN